MRHAAFMEAVTPPLLLGSSSPRRRELLQLTGLAFEVVTPDFDEESVVFTGNPVVYVQEIAQGKLRTLRARHPNHLILCADTTVYCHGEILNKPVDMEHAVEMLQTLSGKTHQVLTAVAVGLGENEWIDTAQALVTFTALSPAQIQAYHRVTPVLDKAGGYTIQGAGALLVEQMVGTPDTVTGLPLHLVSRMLRQCGVDVWESLARTFGPWGSSALDVAQPSCPSQSS